MGIFDEWGKFFLGEESDHFASGSPFDVFSIEVVDIAHEAESFAGGLAGMSGPHCDNLI